MLAPHGTIMWVEGAKIFPLLFYNKIEKFRVRKFTFN